MSLTENDAIRMAEALDDYDQVTVIDIRGRDADCSVVIRDERFATFHELTSRCDQLDFLAAFAGHRPYLFELDDDEISSGAAAGSAAHVAATAPEGPHSVTVWNLPAALVENAGKHELECVSCGVIGAVTHHELAIELADLHRTFFGPLRDLEAVWR